MEPICLYSRSGNNCSFCSFRRNTSNTRQLGFTVLPHLMDFLAIHMKTLHHSETSVRRTIPEQFNVHQHRCNRTDIQQLCTPAHPHPYPAEDDRQTGRRSHRNVVSTWARSHCRETHLLASSTSVRPSTHLNVSAQLSLDGLP